MKIDWSVVPILSKSDVFVSIDNRGRVRFSKQMSLLISSNRFFYCKPVYSRVDNVEYWGFSFSNDRKPDYSTLRFRQCICMFYNLGFAQLVCKDQVSISYDLCFDEKDSIWYFYRNI